MQTGVCGESPIASVAMASTVYSSNGIWIPEDSTSVGPGIITTTGNTTYPIEWYGIGQLAPAPEFRLVEALRVGQFNSPPPVEEEEGPQPVKKYGRVLEP